LLWQNNYLYKYLGKLFFYILSGCLPKIGVVSKNLKSDPSEK
jgi:hypothetical protein